MKAIKINPSSKETRKLRVLLGLVGLFLEDGVPVGSKTLQTHGFKEISSATIRNYFAQLENEGYLQQQHVSGGRIPTAKGLRFYADAFLDWDALSKTSEEKIRQATQKETKEIASYLQSCADQLAKIAKCAVFISAPRFDQDFIRELKLVAIDSRRFLCVIITEFGIVNTEILNADDKINTFSLKRIERYFQWRITGHNEPSDLTQQEQFYAQKFYNEILVRYIVSYSNYIDEDIYRTGFSALLNYPDYHDPNTLAQTLSLFENAKSMSLLLRETTSQKRLKYWIEDDLCLYTSYIPKCCVIAHPYSIHTQMAGGIGILGPSRVPYKELFGLIRYFSHNLSLGLTKNLYKHKIHYRKPEHTPKTLECTQLLIEDQRRL